MLTEQTKIIQTSQFKEYLVFGNAFIMIAVSHDIDSIISTDDTCPTVGFSREDIFKALQMHGCKANAIGDCPWKSIN